MLIDILGRTPFLLTVLIFVRRLLNGDETESDLEDLMRKYQEIKRKIKDKASGMTKLDLKKVTFFKIYLLAILRSQQNCLRLKIWS